MDALFPKAIASEEEKEAEDTAPCTFERRGEALGKASCVIQATSTTTTTTTKTPTTGATTTTKPANDGGHDYDHDKEEAKKEASGGKNKEKVVKGSPN